jgi:hypothetical protein
MQCINVEVCNIDSAVGTDRIDQFAAIPQIGSEIAVEDSDFRVENIIYYSLSSILPHRSSYITLYVERVK